MDQEPIEQINLRWRYRRRIAFQSLYAVFALTVAVLTLAVSDRAGRLADFEGFLVTVVCGLLTLTGAYMGVATWYDVKGRQ